MGKSSFQLDQIVLVKNLQHRIPEYDVEIKSKDMKVILSPKF